MKQIVSFSGGKDSTAMLHMMLERGEQIDEVIFFDTGWEFPQMLDHVDAVEKRTDMKITRLHPRKPFNYWLSEHPVKGRTGENKGKVYRTGNGWPSPMRRWCTREKVGAIQRHLDSMTDMVQCLGIAADEINRTYIRTDNINRRYPLVEYDVAEAEALEYCRNLGYTWGGLYDIFRRVSCFCCPLQRKSELRKLYLHFPELWQRLLAMESSIPEGSCIGFQQYETAHQTDATFREMDKQMDLFSPTP
jgi:3'-phosphoadenosine 5'-phosphosulfate sulfotransferase (PAPS reductase)/FAD synthetase